MDVDEVGMKNQIMFVQGRTCGDEKVLVRAVRSLWWVNSQLRFALRGTRCPETVGVAGTVTLLPIITSSHADLTLPNWLIHPSGPKQSRSYYSLYENVLTLALLTFISEEVDKSVRN
jgi:hypothetical protein